MNSIRLFSLINFYFSIHRCRNCIFQQFCVFTRNDCVSMVYMYAHGSHQSRLLTELQFEQSLIECTSWTQQMNERSYERTTDRMNEKIKHIRTFGNEPYKLCMHTNTNTQARACERIQLHAVPHIGYIYWREKEEEEEAKKKSVATIRAMTWILCKLTATQQQQPRAERSGKH